MKDYHYFASSILSWTVDEDLLKCLEKQKRADRSKTRTYQATNCKVYKVPLPVKAHYSISDYVPEVEGIEFIATITY